MNRERESRPRIGSDATFFWDSLSNLEIDDNFRISHNLVLGLAAKYFDSVSGPARSRTRDRDNIMIFLKSLELWVSVEILRHVASRCEFSEGGQVTPSPYPQPSPPLIPPTPPSFPLSPPPPGCVWSGGTQHTQPVLQGCQAEIPAKKLKRGHRKKNFWPNFG